MSRSKDKGTAWETETVRVLRQHGAPQAERRALHGVADRGDVAGIVGVVIEDKAEAHQDLAGWTAELVAEMTNDGADIGLVWAKRVGRTAGLDGYVLMPPIVALRLLARAGYTQPEPEWLVGVDHEQLDQAALDALALELASQYHWATSPCSSNNCPGVTECCYAETIALDGFRAVAESLERTP